MRSVIAVSTISIILAAGLAPTVAAADPLDLPVVLDFQDLSSFVDTNDDPVTVNSDDESDGHRTILGETFTGFPFEINVYSAHLAELSSFDPQEFLDLADAVDPNPASVDDPLETQTFSAADHPLDPERTLEPTIAIATTPTTMSIAWLSDDLATEYNFYLDAVLVASGSVPAFQVDGLDPATNYAVRAESIEEPDPMAVPGELVPLSAALTLSATTLDSPGSSARSGPPVEVSSSEFNMRTFIPVEYVKQLGDPGTLALANGCLAANSFDIEVADFAGDNRSFQPPSDVRDYRTMMAAQMNWTPGNLILRRDTGITRVMDTSTDAELDSLRANVSLMQFTDVQIGPSAAFMNISHAATDPFCPRDFSLGEIGAIVYKGALAMYKNGLTTFAGWHTMMPSYEAYVRWNVGTWAEAYRQNAVSLICLLLQFPETGCIKHMYISENGPLAEAPAPIPASTATFTPYGNLNFGTNASLQLSFLGDPLPRATYPYGEYFVEWTDLESAAVTQNMPGLAAELAEWAPGPNQYHSWEGSEVTDIRAWVNGQEIRISQAGWKVEFWGDFRISNLDASFDGRAQNSIARAWFNNGRLSFKVDGGPPNVVQLGTYMSEPAGDVFYGDMQDTSADYDARSWSPVTDANYVYLTMVGSKAQLTMNIVAQLESSFHYNALRSLPSARPGSRPGFIDDEYFAGSLDTVQIRLSDNSVLVSDDVSLGDPEFIPYSISYDDVGSSRVRLVSFWTVPMFDFGSATMSEIKDLMDGSTVSFNVNGVPHSFRISTSGYRTPDSFSW